MINYTPKKAIHLILIFLFLAATLVPVPGGSVSAAKPVGQEEGEVSDTGDLLSGQISPDLQAVEEIQLAPAILCYTTQGTTNTACTRLATLYSPVTTVTSAAAFPASLASFQVIYIGHSSVASLSAKATQIQAFVQNGGGLIVEQPNAVGPVAILPPGFELNVSSIFNSTQAVSFTLGGWFHPITLGLNTVDPSGNFETVPTSSLGSSWTMLLKANGFPHAALLAGSYGSGRIIFHTGNIGTNSGDPGSNNYVKRLVDWAGKVVITPGPDMRINKIEVTQAIQDLNNSVDLVANKRTYVRVHVSSPTSISSVTANLSGKRGTTTLTPVLNPGNPGGNITVKTSPDRGQINDSFWFELPSSWLAAGNLTLTATLDPSNSKVDPVFSNNTLAVTVNFKTTPTMRLRLVNVRYKTGSTYYKASNFHLNMAESWLRRAYPISNLSVVRSTYDYPFSGLPNVNTLHGLLVGIKAYRVLFSGESLKTIYYGLVDDGGGFMRGKALGIPGSIAAGPTGPTTSRFTWDTDGSYGDWYTAHEIGHTRNRYHAEFCGAEGGKSYPYSMGRISPSTTGNTAIYGFDITSRTIYPPTWTDVMTYCSNQWISDFTYEGIRSYLVAVGLMESRAILQAEQVLLVAGIADLQTGTTQLYQVEKLNVPAELEEPLPGDWTLALVNAANNDVAVYPFAPFVMTDDEEEPNPMGIIDLLVPFTPGTVKVEIRFQGKVVASRSASPNAPTVKVTEPKRGSELRGEFNIGWDGNDPDGDPLTYSVLYSNDGGETWETLGTGLEEENLTVNRDDLPGGNNRIKVIANDGFNSGMGESETFYVYPHDPQAQITNPGEGDIFYPAQNITFQGEAYDMEDGTIDDDAAFSWSSNKDGELGTGRTLITADLSEGTHLITLKVTDSDGGFGFAALGVLVATADVPEPTILEVAPFSVGVIVYEGTPSTTHPLTLRTSNDLPVSWSVSGGSAWLNSSATSGATPSDLVLTFNTGSLAIGIYEATLTYTANASDNKIVVIPITLQVLPKPSFDLFLPAIRR
jgi:hypothetical protein